MAQDKDYLTGQFDNTVSAIIKGIDRDVERGRRYAHVGAWFGYVIFFFCTCGTADRSSALGSPYFCYFFEFRTDEFS